MGSEAICARLPVSFRHAKVSGCRAQSCVAKASGFGSSGSSGSSGSGHSHASHFSAPRHRGPEAREAREARVQGTVMRLISARQGIGVRKLGKLGRLEKLGKRASLQRAGLADHGSSLVRQNGLARTRWIGSGRMDWPWQNGLRGRQSPQAQFRLRVIFV